jgi:hypothetical protein
MEDQSIAGAGGSMSYQFRSIRYDTLNSRQQENFNFQKLAGHLADYGFYCMRLSDDWMGADLIACHTDGKTILRIQLKGRIVVDEKYIGKGLYIACMDRKSPGDWFIYPHDELLRTAQECGALATSKIFQSDRVHNWRFAPKYLAQALEPFRVPVHVNSWSA